MTQRALLVVAKQPAPGQTKTRLSPPLDPAGASALYECFLRDTLDIVRMARQALKIRPIIAYLPLGAEHYFANLAPEFELLPQQGTDLSERLHNALSHCLSNGYDQAVIMDSDSPTLPAANICSAFTALDGPNDVSLGPCNDGGYYLIGIKRPAPDLFLKVKMSTPQVVTDTLKQAQLNRLRVEVLPESYDIDYVEDLLRLHTELTTLPVHIATHTRAFLATNPSILQGKMP